MLKHAKVEAERKTPAEAGAVSLRRQQSILLYVLYFLLEHCSYFGINL